VPVGVVCHILQRVFSVRVVIKDGDEALSANGLPRSDLFLSRYRLQGVVCFKMGISV
jgi:hypothetical protein